MSSDLVDLQWFPPTLIQDLMDRDKPCIVAHCIGTCGHFSNFDRNNWAETNESLAMQETIAKDKVLFEGNLSF